jgi:M6 family metalloprotease-like protein
MTMLPSVKRRVVGLAILLSLSLLPAYSATPPKAGSVCSKQGVTKTYKDRKYTCIKSGKKLVWNRGVVVKKATPTPTLTPTSTPTPIPNPNPNPNPNPTPSQTSVAKEDWTETPQHQLYSSKLCEISRPSGYNEDKGHYGFPRGANFLPSEGTIRALIVHVEFADAKARISTSENALPYIEEFTKYWTEMSRDKVRFEVESLNEWISLPKTAYEYAGEWNHVPQMENYAKEVLFRADPLVNFSNYRIVYIIPTDNVKKFFQAGPVIASGVSTYFSTAEGPINNLVIGTNPEISMGGVKWKWLAHETGHLFGIDHPHSYENNDKKLASIFSLMDFGFVAPGLYGIERWIAGWVPEQQIRCIDGRKLNEFNYIHKIKPLGSSNENEIISIRLSERRMLIAENRQRNDFDKLPNGYEGLFVYEVDSARIIGPVKPILGSRFDIDLSKPEYNGSRVVGTLRVGESVTFEGIHLTVLDNKDGTLLVRTERK